MNPPANEDRGAQRPARGQGRGQARGGRSIRNAPRSGAAGAKAPAAKIGPSRLLETEWVKDSVLKGNVFVVNVSSGTAGDQQWTFHHPIGESSLSERQWVATPTRDIGFLLMRRDSEALVAWKRQAELAKRRAVLTAQQGRKTTDDGQTEVWAFDGAPAIQPTIRTCMAAAKAAGANESEWLTYADRTVQTAERTFKESLRTQATPQDWLRANPRPVHETMGGTLGNIHQTAVSHLDGLSVAAAKDKVLRVMIGIDNANESPPPTAEEETPTPNPE